MTETEGSSKVELGSVVFVAGHWLGHCDREHGQDACDCDEHYVAIFNRCPECAGPLDTFGECDERCDSPEQEQQ